MSTKNAFSHPPDNQQKLPHKPAPKKNSKTGAHAGAPNEAPDDGDGTMRLQSFLSQRGVCSRRGSVELLSARQVTVNGTVVTEPGFRIDPTRDAVLVRGAAVSAPSAHRYLLFHKPVQVESTNARLAGRLTSADYIRHYHKGHIFCAGRLDYMSSGLMIYTTDGDLAYRLTHPKYEVKKTYLVQAAVEIPEELLRAWKQGIVIDGVRYTLTSFCYERPQKHAEKPREKYGEKYGENFGARFAEQDPAASRSNVSLVLREGKNREIRVVFAHGNIPIRTLHRTAIGPFTLGDLEVGEVREADARSVARALSGQKNDK